MHSKTLEVEGVWWWYLRLRLSRISRVTRPRSRNMPMAQYELSAWDRLFFNACRAPISGVYTYTPSRPFGDDHNLVRAFSRAVRVSPLLQTRVDGMGDGAVFRACSREGWPKLTVAPHIEADDAAAVEAARALMKGEVDAITSGGHEGQRTSVRAHVVRGPTSIVLALVAPHHFVDGIATASLTAKFVLYATAPRLLWPLLDLLSDARQPTFDAGPHT